MKKYYLHQKLAFVLFLLLGTFVTNAQTTYTVNASGGADFTTISAAVSAAVNGDIIMVSGTITGDGVATDGILVNKDLVISGQGASLTTVEASTTESDAGINRRVFTIAPGATVTLKDMTIRHGYLNTGVNYDGGGGVKTSGALIVENCVITKNHVHTQSYQFGGGILTDGLGSLTVESSTISNNSSSGWAGGICHGNYGGPDLLILKNSTLTGNSSPGRAGALLIMICGQDNQITNCTFEGNSSGSFGVLFNDRSSATYTNNTFVNNTCSGGGGAIYLYAGTMNMKNNLLANNTESGGGTPNDFRYQSGTVNDNGNNLVEFSANYTFTGTGDITGDQPSLNISGALADNGTLNGTQTLALNTGSVAIDAGSTGSNGSVTVPCKDQRGLFDNGSKDIGAYEFGASSTVPYAIAIETSPVDQTACVSENVTFTVSSSNGLYYQWVKDGVDLIGETSATLTVNGLVAGDAGEYYCRVSDDCVASNSDTAELTLYNTVGCVPPSSILHVDPASFTGTISPSSDVFASTPMKAISCTDVDVSFIGVELDAASAGGGVLKIGLYEGNTLVYETAPLSVTGGIDELVGEAVPPGTVTMNSSSAYKLGLIYSGPNYVYLKTSVAPTHLGIAEFENTFSFYSNSTVYPTLPNPWSIQGGWGFNIAFRIDGVPNTSNTTGTISPVACDSYTSPSGNHTWTTSGTYMDTIPNAAGCDSLLTINLTINNSTSGSESVTACDSYTWSTNGTTYTTSGAYTATLTNAVGCDSTATLNLTINNSTSGSESVTACDSYTWSANGTTYTTSGAYTATLTNAVGCDSTATLNLTINNSTSGSESVTACDSYTWSANGTTYTTSGAYTATLANAAGCDSTATLNLTINNSTSGSENVSACGSYTWSANGTTYTTSGAYTATLTNAVGCDSTATLNLTINTATSGSESVTACDSYTWSANGTTYTTSGTYTATLTNSVGCDSTATLNLTVNSSSTGSESMTTCDSYTWPLTGMTYTTSGMYTAVLTNAVGCDSIITLDLTINNATTGTDVVSACDSFTWIDGNTYTASNNTATYVLTNSNGCDSIVTLDLTINYTMYATETMVSCGPFTWVDGNTYSSSTNTPTMTYTTSAGCDYIVTLDLTVLEPTSSVDVVSACESYTWIDGNTYTSSNNSATYTMTNSVGCDSVITLDLTINMPDTVILTETALDSYTLNNEVYYESGVYTQVLQGSEGCDSIIILNLTMEHTGLNEINQVVLEVYPNPVNDVFNVSASQELFGDYTIVDIRGREVLQGHLTGKETSINIENLETGPYLMRLSDSDQVVRIIKQ